MALVIDGKLLYLKMIKGESSTIYIKLKSRFDALLKQPKDQTSIIKKKTDIVDLVLEMGLDAAMEYYTL